MPESKRIFNAGKMNRDLDDRLVPPGEYRDALNVGIGRSEGSDVGAVENLKGNVSINPDTLVVSGTNVTTIGVVRDPHNDRIYWLNTGGGYDAIYEYDESTGNITPIISEPTNRTATLPTCAPDLLSRITEPMGNSGSRTPLRALPTPPSPVCNLPTGPNGRPNTNYVASPSSNQYIDNNTCVEQDPPPTPATDPIAAITGLTIGTTGGSAVQLSGATSTPGTLTGGAAATITSYNWSDDNGGSQTGATATYDVAAPASDEDVVVTLTVTNSGGVTSDPVMETVRFTTTPPTVSAFSLAVSDTIANATSAGNVSDMRAEGATINQAVGITPDSGYEWVDQTALRAALTGTTGDIQLNYTNGSETGTVTGTMPAGTVSLSVVFSGATTQLIPVTPTGNMAANIHIGTLNDPGGGSGFNRSTWVTNLALSVTTPFGTDSASADPGSGATVSNLIGTGVDVNPGDSISFSGSLTTTTAFTINGFGVDVDPQDNWSLTSVSVTTETTSPGSSRVFSFSGTATVGTFTDGFEHFFRVNLTGTIV